MNNSKLVPVRKTPAACQTLAATTSYNYSNHTGGYQQPSSATTSYGHSEQTQGYQQPASYTAYDDTASTSYTAYDNASTSYTPSYETPATEYEPSDPLPGIRCPTCAAEGREVWVLPGRACGYCGTPCW